MNDQRNNLNDIDAMLSAYVDGELDFADRRKVEELIQSEPSYAQEVAQLRLLKRWLQNLPAPTPRRSFTLDPQTAPRQRRLVFPTLRWATAIAAVLLMLTVSVDVLGNIGSGFGGGAAGSTMSGAAPAASGSTASGTNASAARSVGAASASGSSAAALPDTAAQEAAVPSASAAAAPNASASAAASASVASTGALASAVTEQSGGAAAAGAYPAQSEIAAATLASASTANASPSASGGAGASIVAAPSLADTGTTAPDTMDTLFAANQQSAPVDTLRIAQIVLLIATVALGAGAWFARRRNI